MRNNIFDVVMSIVGILFTVSGSIFCGYKAVENYGFYVHNIYDYAIADIVIPSIISLFFLFLAHKFAVLGGYEIADYKAYLQEKKNK